GTADQPAVPASAPRSSWVVAEAYHEARAMVRMYFDPRYRMSWGGRVVPLVLCVAILTSWIWLPGTSILPTFLSTPIIKIVDVVLALLAYKILSREVRRYQAALHGPATLPPP